MKFVPKRDQPYFLINSRFEVKQGINGGGARSNARISAGNCFKTFAEAEEFLARALFNIPTSRWEHFKKALGKHD